MPATRAFSRQLVAYIAAFLPTAPYFKSIDGQISAVCDDQYSSTLAMLEETADEKFKVYMTRKTQGWFRRWGCPRPSDAPPGPGAAPTAAGSGAAAATPARPEAPVISDEEEGGTLIPGEGGDNEAQASPTLTMETLPSSGRVSIQDFKPSAHSSHQPSSPRQEGMLTLNSFMISYPKLGDLPSDIAGGLAMIS